jgi:uncharacterized membrane protein (DUF4010 family)
VSFLRVIAIVAVVKPVLLAIIAPPLAAAFIVAVAYALASVSWRGPDIVGGQADFANPFSFWPVVGFALFLGVVILLGRAVSETFGAHGALAGAAAVGLADVDSITVSIARLVPSPLHALDAGAAILVAVVSNMLSKLTLAAVIDRGRFAVQAAVMTAACWLAGVATLWATLAFTGG